MSQDPRCVTGGALRARGFVAGYALRDRLQAFEDLP